MTRPRQDLVLWPAGVDLATWTKTEAAEYERILGLLRSGEIKGDSTLIVFSCDGILQFSRADLVPFFYCSGSVVEEYLKDWTG